MLKVIIVLIVAISSFNNSPKNNNNYCVYGQRHVENQLISPPHREKKNLFHHLISLPQKIFSKIFYTNGGHKNIPPRTKSLPNLSKRFLSSETKHSIGDTSVASKFIIHTNYISQWSNRWYKAGVDKCLTSIQHILTTVNDISEWYRKFKCVKFFIAIEYNLSSSY